MTIIYCEVKECVANKDGKCQGDEIWIDNTAWCKQLELVEEEEEEPTND